MKKYLIISTGISLSFLLLFFGANDVLFASKLHSKFPAMIFFFFLQSLVVSWLLYEGKKNNWESPIYALGTVTFRLLTGLFFLGILMYMKIDGIKALMVQFMAVYLVYLIFELFTVLSNLRRN
ncbi:MAG: hypothetical protein ABJ004_18315 [Cyclobacteriaceae bacterium]